MIHRVPSLRPLGRQCRFLLDRDPSNPWISQREDSDSFGHPTRCPPGARRQPRGAIGSVATRPRIDVGHDRGPGIDRRSHQEPKHVLQSLNICLAVLPWASSRLRVGQSALKNPRWAMQPARCRPARTHDCHHSTLAVMLVDHRQRESCRQVVERQLVRHVQEETAAGREHRRVSLP